MTASEVPRWLLAVAAALALLATSGSARAQKLAAPPAITTSGYSLDLFQGPITTAGRVIGLAGAYTALAEWCEGEYANPAAPAVRAPNSLGKWDYDICFGFTVPGAYANSDFENRGELLRALPTRFGNTTTVNAGIQVQYGTAGITIDADTTLLSVQPGEGASDTFAVTQVTASVANGFLDEQLLIGAGIRTVSVDVEHPLGGVSQTVLSASASAPQLGAIYMPRGLQFRVGAAFRSEVDITNIHGTSQLPDGSQFASGMVLPARVVAPSELELGAVFELGARPLNPPRIDISHAEDSIRWEYDQERLARVAAAAKRVAAAPTAEREPTRRRAELAELAFESREEDEIRRRVTALVEARKARAELWDRRTMLLLVSVLVTGGTSNGIGLADFAAQENIVSGRTASISPRIAFETELIPRWVIGRGGGYVEPARYEEAHPRGHATLGLDIRLFKFNPLGIFGEDPWRLRLAGDAGPRYVNWAVGVGKYH